MNRLLAVLALAICMTAVLPADAAASQLKPRLVVLTDVSTWETDDSESLVRLLVHADLFEIEGLIFTTGWSLSSTRADFLGLIHTAIDAYEVDSANLLKRSGQSGFLKDESRQELGYWPSPNYLRARTVLGSTNRGVAFLGEQNRSAGSDLIIRLTDEEDDRPLWVTVWGGGNTVAQAIWQVQKEQSEEQLRAFLRKLRIYAITDQDREQRTEFEESSHQWMRRESGRDLMFLWDECAWKYQNGVGRKNWAEYEAHIQGHGALGAVYPKYKYGVEGDTPAFLHLTPTGLNDPNEPVQVGWGGYFEYGGTADGKTMGYTNHTGAAHRISTKYQDYFYTATFRNFAARMDWAAHGRGNRNPVVVIDGDASVAVLHRRIRQGTRVSIDASESRDPDGNKMSFRWWVLPEAGTYKGELTIEHSGENRAIIEVPADSAGSSIHLVCEVTDDGEPRLSGYRRIVFEVSD